MAVPDGTVQRVWAKFQWLCLGTTAMASMTACPAGVDKVTNPLASVASSMPALFCWLKTNTTFAAPAVTVNAFNRR